MTEEMGTLLELIRLEGIVKMIMDYIDPYDIKETMYVLFNTEPEDVKSSLSRLSRQQLISIVNYHDEIITIDIVRQYYDQYRYGLKPGFTIYLLIGPQSTMQMENLYMTFKQILENVKDEKDATFKRVRCKNLNMLADAISEISLSYLKKHSYLDENENPQFIYEYEEFFIWVNLREKYMAIKNVPDKVSDLVIGYLGNILDLSIVPVKLTKSIVAEIFGTEQKKGTYMKLDANHNEAEKIIISDGNLKNKPSVMESVSTYNMTSTYLSQTMEDDSHNTLGINCEKGKLYLTKNITASVFRDWSISAIQKLVPYILDLKNLNDFLSFRARNVIRQNDWGCSQNQAGILEQVVYGIFCAYQSGHKVAYLNCDVKRVWENTKAYWLPRFTFDCPTCGEKSIMSCPYCGSSLLAINKAAKIVCKGCCEVLDICNCDEGRVYSTFSVKAKEL